MQNLRLTAQGKTHAAIIEKFLAKWLQAQLVENGQSFQEGVARQLKSSQQQNIQIKHLACLSAWIETPQSSLWANVAVAENLATALHHSGGSKPSTIHFNAGWFIMLVQIG